MPEGDTVWHTAAILRGALVGNTLTRCDVRVPKYATVDLTGVFRLTFSWSASNPATGATGGAQALLAEPEVLCAL